MLIDPNNRLDPYTQQPPSPATTTPQRIVHIALPFLALYAPARNVVTVYVGLERTWSVITGNGSLPSKCWNVAFCVSQVACAIILPTATSISTSVIAIGNSSYQMLICLKNVQLKDASMHLLSIVNSTIYLGSITLGMTELIFVSLLAQAVKELYIAYSEGRRPESIAALLMAITRISQAVVHGKTLHRNYYGKQLSQADFEAILDSILKTNSEKPEQKIVFDKLLENGNFSNRVQRLNFVKSDMPVFRNIDFNQTRFTQCHFRGIIFSNSNFSSVKFESSTFQLTGFVNCNFMASTFDDIDFISSSLVNTNFFHSAIIDAHFGHSNITNTTFTDTWMDHNLFHHSFIDSTRWEDSHIRRTGLGDNSITNSSFVRTHISDGNFVNAHLQNVRFEESKTPFVAFNDATLDQVSFVDCVMKGTTFLETKVGAATIEESDLTDTVFAGTEKDFTITGGTPQNFTGPVIGVRWDFVRVGGYTIAEYEAVKDNGGIPLRFDTSVPGISADTIHQETEDALAAIAARGIPQDSLSIADAILRHAPDESALAKLNQRADTITKHIQGLLLPGGLDIDPRFYGQTEQAELYVDRNHSRTMTEFAVIAQAEKKELPTLAICRGNQVYNVYRGGTLKQHIDNHEDLDHRLTIDENADPRAAEIMRGIIGNETEGYSNHHQALDKVADNLNVVIRHDGDVEASMTLDGRVIALQFHPENYIFERREAVIQLAVNPNYQYPHHKGKRFFEHLISSARAIHHRATEDTEIATSVTG